MKFYRLESITNNNEMTTISNKNRSSINKYVTDSNGTTVENKKMRRLRMIMMKIK